MSTKRTIGRPFAKGTSGNPGGRPAIDPDLRAACQAHTSEAVETLVKAMRDPKAPIASKIRAAEIILERGHGKAPLTFDGTSGPGSFAELLNGIAEEAARDAAAGLLPDSEQVH